MDGLERSNNQNPLPPKPEYEFVKRLLDVSVGLTLLVLLAIPLLCIAIAVYVSSPGGVFYRQKRVDGTTASSSFISSARCTPAPIRTGLFVPLPTIRALPLSVASYVARNSTNCLNSSMW